MSGQVHSLALGRVIPRPRLQVCLPRIAEITLPFQRAAFTVSVQKQEKHHVLPPRYLLVTYCAHVTCLGRSLPQGSVAATAQARGRRAPGGGATSRLLASGVSAQGQPGDTPRRGGPGPVPVTNDRMARPVAVIRRPWGDAHQADGQASRQRQSTGSRNGIFKCQFIVTLK